MEFCEVCDNLLHLSVKEDEAVYECQACNTTKLCGDNFDPCIFKNNYGGNEEIFYDMYINKYTLHDPTLPRVSTITCPNKECESHAKTSEVIYVRYHEADMKYIYLCCHCKRAWIHPEYQQHKWVLNLNETESENASKENEASTGAK